MAVQLVLIKSEDPSCLSWPDLLYQSLRDTGGLLITEPLEQEFEAA
ncbi:hypothetical protein [Mesorhizobium sp. WSM3860]|nr:hypothetical protein [Mesorhizobium sp. WSM3860]